MNIAYIFQQRAKVQKYIDEKDIEAAQSVYEKLKTDFIERISKGEDNNLQEKAHLILRGFES